MEIDITVFAALHKLTLQIHERHGEMSESMRYYAKFDGVEVSAGYCLESTFGNGRTREEAVADYAKSISNKRLVVNSYQFNRREIDAPTLTYNVPKKVHITVEIETDYESMPPRFSVQLKNNRTGAVKPVLLNEEFRGNAELVAAEWEDWLGV